jgi:DNA polymerase III epsilon subunit-like protein
MMTQQSDEVFISVDVETSGPIPREYSLLSIGACVVGQSKKTFYQLLKPTTRNFVPKALEVAGLSLDELEHAGETPQVAMQAFANWVKDVSGKEPPVFVGLNAAFDWSFINYYFHRFLGENPFGFTALDIKSLYMGMTGSSWRDTRSSKMSEVLKPSHRSDHHALGDAEAQAELFERILKRIRK